MYEQTNEGRIAQLHPTVARMAREWLRRVTAEGIAVCVVQGLRTIEEQNELYAQGRTKPGQIVTQVSGGYSYHNYGLAFDFCMVNPDGSLDWNVGPKWRRAAAIGKEIGFDWGGDWTGFIDYPHLEYTCGLTCQQLRNGATLPEDNYKEEDEPMTAAEREEFEVLKAQNATILKTLDVHIEKINDLEEACKEIPAPEWAKEAAEYFKCQISGEGDEEVGTRDFWRTLVIQYRKEKGLTV